MKVIIVGGVAGGASTATRLRRLDESAEIIMFEKGEYVSFANCGLPYHLGGTIEERSKLLLQTPESLKARFNIDVRNHSEVIAVDVTRKVVTVRHPEKGEYEESYDKLVLAPGAKPMRPPIPGIENEGIYSLRNIPDMDRIKAHMEQKKAKSAVVIGGGFIGIEVAENLREKGLEVTLIEAAPQIVAPVDPEIAYRAVEELQEHGVRVILNNGVNAFKKEQDQIITTLQDGSTYESDFVILAIGVTPDTAFLKDSGIKLSDRGHLLVNEKMETSAPDVYGLGDAIMVKDFVTGELSFVPLAGPANRQGRIVADCITGRDSKFPGTMGTSILKVFDLVIASTGNNEKLLIHRKVPYKALYLHPQSHASYYPGASPISIKVLYNEEGKLLGAQATGYEGVDKVIDTLAMAMTMGADIYDLMQAELAYAPPFLSAKSPANMAGFIAENDLKGLSPLITPKGLEALQEKEEVVVIDIRNQLELASGMIKGAKHIPLDNLRGQLSELDSNKTYVIYCAVGQRGHTGVRLMLENGFKAYNLTGGYKTYSLYMKAYNHQNTLERPNKSKDSEEKPKKKVDKIAKNVDATGMCCPGPIVRVKQELDQLQEGTCLSIKASDPGFYEDIKAWCHRTHNPLVQIEKNKGITKAVIKKGAQDEISLSGCSLETQPRDGKTIVVFSGDLDKAIASFIIANGAASMGKKVTLFFTFWGLNILRKHERIRIKKNFMEKGFSMMMPRGSKKLGLSKMNMGGLGGKMIRKVMKDKNVQSLEELMQLAMANGVEIVACTMSMDVMGIKQEELIDGVKLGGVGYYLGEAEDANVNLFI